MSKVYKYDDYDDKARMIIDNYNKRKEFNSYISKEELESCFYEIISPEMASNWLGKEVLEVIEFELVQITNYEKDIAKQYGGLSVQDIISSEAKEEMIAKSLCERYLGSGNGKTDLTIKNNLFDIGFLRSKNGRKTNEKSLGQLLCESENINMEMNHNDIIQMLKNVLRDKNNMLLILSTEINKYICFLKYNGITNFNIQKTCKKSFFISGVLPPLVANCKLYTSKNRYEIRDFDINALIKNNLCKEVLINDESS